MKAQLLLSSLCLSTALMSGSVEAMMKQPGAGSVDPARAARIAAIRHDHDEFHEALRLISAGEIEAGTAELRRIRNTPNHFYALDAIKKLPAFKNPADQQASDEALLRIVQDPNDRNNFKVAEYLFEKSNNVFANNVGHQALCWVDFCLIRHLASLRRQKAFYLQV
jgi:hypothetical protein